MIILKLKKDVDVKELEKHLIKLNIMDDNKCIHKNVYCCVEEEEKYISKIIIYKIIMFNSLLIEKEK